MGLRGYPILNEGHTMEDPEKEKFILKAVDTIKSLKKRVESARKNKEDMAEVMTEVQEKIKKIKAESEEIFDSSKVKMSPDELEAYLQNPSNFSREDWELLESIKLETDQCKKEIIKSNEKEAVEDIIGKNKKKKGLKRKRRKSPKYI